MQVGDSKSTRLVRVPVTFRHFYSRKSSSIDSLVCRITDLLDIVSTDSIDKTIDGSFIDHWTMFVLCLDLTVFVRSFIIIRIVIYSRYFDI